MLRRVGDVLLRLEVLEGFCVDASCSAFAHDRPSDPSLAKQSVPSPGDIEQSDLNIGGEMPQNELGAFFYRGETCALLHPQELHD